MPWGLAIPALAVPCEVRRVRDPAPCQGLRVGSVVQPVFAVGDRSLRRAVVLVALGLVPSLGACANPFAEQEGLPALDDPAVVQYLPREVPSGWSLWSIQPVPDQDEGGVAGVESFYENGDSIVVLCATDDAELARSICRASDVEDEQVSTVEREGTHTVTVDCASETCAAFSPDDWLAKYGTEGSPDPPRSG